MVLSHILQHGLGTDSIVYDCIGTPIRLGAALQGGATKQPQSSRCCDCTLWESADTVVNDTRHRQDQTEQHVRLHALFNKHAGHVARSVRCIFLQRAH